MIRMGLRLTLRSGREAFVRLAVMAAAVAVGVALLLAVLAEFNAYQANSHQPCWSCTLGSGLPRTLPARGDLWNSSVDFYQGHTIRRLDVAPLGPGAPVPPGISHLPAPGHYFASPALAALIRSAPAGQLGDRFPGTLSGTIGHAALLGPSDLVVYVGYSRAALASIPGTTWVTRILSAPAQEVFTPFFRYAFGVGVLAVLFPMLILVGMATRLAAARREERFAALRLVGAVPGDVAVFASVEALAGALAGTVLGIAVFLLARPVLAGASPIGVKYFPATVTPMIWGYLAMLVAVPAASVLTALVSLRRVQISPLGAVRRATPPRPGIWRLAVLVLAGGVLLFGLLKTHRQSIGAAAYPGLLLTMTGLVIAGPWLTWAAAWVFGRVVRGASPLLAARRLTDNPRVASRAVNGLVLAAFLGTMVGALLPAVESISKTPNAGVLSNVLEDQLGLSPHDGATLVRDLRAIHGTSVYPLYLLPGAITKSLIVPKGARHAGPPGHGRSGPPGRSIQPGQAPTYDTVVSCQAMRGLAVLGQCRPGARAVKTFSAGLFSDNPRNSTQPFVFASDPAYPHSLSGLSLEAVLVRVNNAATLERVRTFLAVHAPPNESGGAGQAPTPARTFGELVAIRSERAVAVEKIVYAAVALTIVVAGCSLAVAVGGGLVDRKRPFTMLRVNGTPAGTLTRVVLLEAGLPLGAALVIAGGIAYGTSIMAFIRLAPPGTAVPMLGHVYYETMGAGLAIALLAIMGTIPLMRRMTDPGNVHFE